MQYIATKYLCKVPAQPFEIRGKWERKFGQSITSYNVCVSVDQVWLEL